MENYNGDLKVVISKQDTLIKKIDKIDDKMDEVCDLSSRHDERIKKSEEEITGLRTRSNINDIAVAIAAAIASAVAAVFGANR